MVNLTFGRITLLFRTHPLPIDNLGSILALVHSSRMLSILSGTGVLLLLILLIGRRNNRRVHVPALVGLFTLVLLAAGYIQSRIMKVSCLSSGNCQSEVTETASPSEQSSLGGYQSSTLPPTSEIAPPMVSTLVLPPNEPQTTLLSPQEIIPDTGSTSLPNQSQNDIPPTTSSERQCKPFPVDMKHGLTDWPYIVNLNDDLPNLAERFHGSADRWPELYEANRDVIGQRSLDGTPPPIFPGQLLRIPSVTNPIHYMSLDGDNLGGIATKYYGDGAQDRWCTVYFTNSDSIGQDPNILQSNMELLIYRLVDLEKNQIWALPGDKVYDYALGYLLDQTKYSDICLANNRFVGGDCDLIRPFDIITIPDLAEATTYIVQPGDTWNSIAQLCYGYVLLDFVMAIEIANRRVVGIGPPADAPIPGQILTLWKCSQ